MHIPHWPASRQALTLPSPTFWALQSGVSRELFEAWCEDPRNCVVIADFAVQVRVMIGASCAEGGCGMSSHGMLHGDACSGGAPVHCKLNMRCAAARACRAHWHATSWATRPR